MGKALEGANIKLSPRAIFDFFPPAVLRLQAGLLIAWERKDRVDKRQAAAAPSQGRSSRLGQLRRACGWRSQPPQDARHPQNRPQAWNGPLLHPFYSKVLKRGLDFSLALALLPFFAAVMLPIALLVKLTSKGPVFYSALRGGYRNRPFNILKFRTMVVGADKYSGTTALNDPRVTRLGRVLRGTKLDELPQILNILKGDMSFIGPRPELLKYTGRYTPGQQCILWVRPGISDPSSIHLFNLDAAVGHDDPEGSYERDILADKNDRRVAYARNQSFGLDASLFFITLGCVLRRLFAGARDGTAGEVGTAGADPGQG